MLDTNQFHITADLYLYKTEDGGRKGPLPTQLDYRCPMSLETDKGEVKYDCLIRTTEHKELNPGDRINNIRIYFLSPEDVSKLIYKGKRFKLWESGFIGEGTIHSIELQS